MFKKLMKKAVAVAAAVTVLASVALAAGTKIYYTDDKADLEEDRESFKIETLVAETTADADITELNFQLDCAADVTFNEYAAMCFIVTVDGTETVYKIMGIGPGGDEQFKDYEADEWTPGISVNGKVTLDSKIASGSKYKVEGFTQSWAGAAAEVYTVTMLQDAPAAESSSSTVVESSSSAVVESSSAATDNNTQTGDNTMVAVLAVVAVLALAGVVVTSKKRA